LKKNDDHAIIRVVIATGISSVVTQLITIREFLTQFQGNEIVIALILFNWLVLGGVGTLLARMADHRNRQASAVGLAWMSLILSGLGMLQILAIRLLRDMIFIHGSSVGFYPTWLFTFSIITPYCLLLGFVLPYSLFVIRTDNTAYPGARIYITDNIGDITGGVLFSFVLVYLVSPLQAILLAHLPLLGAVYLLFPVAHRHRPSVLLCIGLIFVILTAGVMLEKRSLTPPTGELVYYRETRYGRIAVHKDQEQYTLFEDGVPSISSQNLSLSEEIIHYPLAGLDPVNHVLLISAQGGVMAELKKYDFKTVDYIELNAAVTDVQFRYRMIENIPGLNVLHQDGRAYLAQTDKIYDAIIVNLPEPGTFQINRFYTHRFFELARKHLSAGGVLSFSMQGYDNYLAEPQRQKLSSLYNTVKAHFKNVLLLPGQKVFFLCSDRPPAIDIPAALEQKNVDTAYISGFFYGNLTRQRIDYLNQRLDSSTPLNTDTAPHLMRLMFSQWFAKFQTSPLGFFLALAVLSMVYLLKISREEYVLFSTGCMTMGSEILVIFAFQIYFGYIYLQIGIIITVFLAGLLPGAWLGHKLQRPRRRVLVLTDGLLIAILVSFILAIVGFADRLPVSFFLIFGFLVSMACGFQFPVALSLKGSDNTAATRSFSADLMGAACGTLLTSVVLIPYIGILPAAGVLIGLKLISLVLMGTKLESKMNIEE
jgi:spermidine synthase